MIEIKKLTKKINYPLLAFLLVIIIGSITLLFKPVIGMADNGDFYRIMSINGVYHLHPDNPDIFNKYFIKDYGIYKYYNENRSSFLSTQSIFIKIAVFISRIINKNYILDIRCMSWIFILVHAVGVYLIIKALTMNMKTARYKLFLVLLVTFIFCDTAYLAYYNSFYGEAVNLSFFIISIGILLNIIQTNDYSVKKLTAFCITSFIFFGAKQQLAPIGIFVMFIFIKIAVTEKKKNIKILSSCFAVFFLLSSILFYKAISGEFKYINSYHSMNRGMLLYKNNPEQVMKFFNISNQYSLLKETTFYDNVTLTELNDDEIIENYYEKFSTVKVVEYYMTYPDEFLKMIKIAFNNGYSIRPKAMGNYEKYLKKAPKQQAYDFSLYSLLKERIFTQNTVLSIVFVIFCVYEFLHEYYLSYKNNDYKIRKIIYLYIYIFFIGISQLIISIIGAGDADLAKHVFMYNVSFDMLIIYFIWIKIRKLDLKRVNQ